MRCCVWVLAAVAALAPSIAGAAEKTWADRWSGVYGGLTIGGGFANSDWTNTKSKPAGSFFDYTPGQGFSDGLSGVFGGAQIGVNMQRGPWVVGLELMVDASDIGDDFNSNSGLGAADDKFKAKIDTLFLATGRIGYAWDEWLAYAKGGYAAARLKVSVSDNTAPSTGSGSDSQWRSGPVVGLGIEYRITPELSIAAEYNHIWLDSGSYQLGGSAGSYLWDVDVSGVDLVMARLNYRFASF
jgi:outer membrane immunogenic protein